MTDTIYALSSGAPPAAIAVIRISGPAAGEALSSLTGRSFEPRRTALARLRDGAGATLDEALVLWLPGPDNATGEDTAELHCHGGRAVVAAVTSALSEMEGLRPAEPGEFTRRAFANGRLDLAEAEGLGDLLTAETELQRRAAMDFAGGGFSRQIGAWNEQVLRLSAEVESALDFSDEDDVPEPDAEFRRRVAALRSELDTWLERPAAEKLREGYRVALAGPPNAGKSTLFNALIEREAAIVSDIAGTTRDVIEAPVALGGVPFTFVDTAGLRCETDDVIERIGIDRADAELARADCVLWLGEEGGGPDSAVEISPFADLAGKGKADGLSVSAITGQGIGELKAILIERARQALPKPGEAALNARQRTHLVAAAEALGRAAGKADWILLGEELRTVRAAFDRLLGRASTEDMLDTLFARFCIGK
ncbi:tRNA uridine-5-carboxymethylaminomethyl(34) synthesis GTPase MnmE [Alteriqipengyuania flavescens]|uniref:tRNA uridine-5-carboxymethylaminomethyl(34) synthesis GTPase MnmE n=1 Tax=Alteriqipengyuania flavescens TaxID=3053610 RepID=UPI0025B2B350|nr:tRNA uridine-5-carboxymethylaminomethyl(34) synthesis GTPase MnmE [Alteriqipengyuania flavescens]WJY19585.1 tRNA uridine-5-carboxymethylaminomethyl(34) synthesis GTPase MnmE [Alteriqipengyuania flavescens]WJY25525.1 tRNA uridine-5-carboxymethylaminomethyl(34) synthesis GTPase MnmE [Alteriqipengyuania flavescens]